MRRFSIGIILDSFRLPLAESLDLAAGLGAQGIQVYATKGVMAPENMNSEQPSLFFIRCWIADWSFPPCAAIWAGDLAMLR